MILTDILSGVISGIIVLIIAGSVGYLFRKKLKKYWDRIIQHKVFDAKIRVGSQVQTRLSYFLEGMKDLPDELNNKLVNGEVVKIDDPLPGQKPRTLHVELNKEHNAAIEYTDGSVERMDRIAQTRVARIPENRVIKLYPKGA